MSLSHLSFYSFSSPLSPLLMLVGYTLVVVYGCVGLTNFQTAFLKYSLPHF